MAAISQRQEQILTESIDSYISTIGLKKLGIKCGYNINANFLPQELKDFSSELTKLALPTIKENLHAKGEYKEENLSAIKKNVHHLFYEKLQANCKIIPQNEIRFDYPSMWVWVRSLLWES